jgi:uncharacterized DUF497 family protein
MLAISRLIWDDWNVIHISRHSIDPGEVEEVCHNDPLVKETYGGRLRAIGITNAGRALTVVLALKTDSGDYYPVTARPASSKERALYRGEVKAHDDQAA